MKKVLLVLTALMMTIPAFAAEGISGTLSFDYATDIKKAENYRRDVRLDLNFNYSLYDTQVKACLRGEDDSVRLVDASRIYLREAFVSQDIYINSFINSLNFKAGRIIYTWGNADEMKPTDILNPQDLSFLMFNAIQDRKYGIWSGSMTIYITEDVFVEAIALEEFMPSEVMNSSVFKMKQLEMMKTTPFSLTEALPDQNDLTNIKFASRIGAVLFDIDAHLSCYMGYDHLPTVEMTFNSPVDIDAVMSYKEIQMIGLDFQRALFSGISIRGEAAYFIKGKYFPLDDTGFETDPMSTPLMQDLLSDGTGMLERHYYDITAGFDAMNMFIDKLYMNLQWNGNVIIDYCSDLKQDQVVNSILGTIEYSMLDDKLKPKIRGFYNVNDNAFVFGAELAWRAGPSYEVKGGVWIFDGDKNSYYGQFRDKDLIFVSGKAEF